MVYLREVRKRVGVPGVKRQKKGTVLRIDINQSLRIGSFGE